MKNAQNDPAVLGPVERPVRPLAARLRDAAQGVDLGADGMGWSPDPELMREAAQALEQCAATIATDTARMARLRPMTEAQIAHLVTEFHRTRRFHGNEPADIVGAVETFHGIRATVVDERPNG